MAAAINEQDVVVLLHIVGAGPGWTVRELAGHLEIARAGVQRSLQRLDRADLFALSRRRLHLSQTEEFLVHAMRYVFPAQLGGEVRGMPTAWAAAPLDGRLAATDEAPPVWPTPDGHVRGAALEPLHPVVPRLAAKDAALGERLALVDAIRVGDARVRRLAVELLVERLEAPSRRR